MDSGVSLLCQLSPTKMWGFYQPQIQLLLGKDATLGVSEQSVEDVDDTA